MKFKRILSTFLCVIMLAITLCACSDPGKFSDSELLSSGYKRNEDVTKTYNYADGAKEPPTTYNSYVNLITGYELKLFRNMAAQDGAGGKSFVFSPAANTLGLSLLADGAKNDTLSEIMLALGSDLTLDDLNACSSYFKSRMETVSKSDDKDSDDDPNQVKLGNTLLVNDKTDVRKTFLQSNADYFSANIARFDFANKDYEDKVNNLLGSPVYDKLNLNKDGSICDITSFGLSDNWLTPYAANAEVDSKFNGKAAKFLASDENYIHSDQAKGIIKYTANNPLKLVLIMPNEDIKIEDYIKSFDSVEYSKLIDSFSVTSRIDSHMPVVEIPQTDDPKPMSPIMIKSGLYTLFSDKSDFSNLAHSKNVKINELYDLQPGITIDRYGVFTSGKEVTQGSIAPTEKPAATSPAESKAATLEFSRPFIFMLIDNESNIPVYMGVYSG